MVLDRLVELGGRRMAVAVFGNLALSADRDSGSPAGVDFVFRSRWRGIAHWHERVAIAERPACTSARNSDPGNGQG